MAFQLSSEEKNKFLEDGFLAIDNFLSAEEVSELKRACGKLVDKIDEDEHKHTFRGTYNNKPQAKEDYFINSVDKIRNFYEADAVDENGELTVPKEVSLNKIGHALHWLEPTFRKVSFSDKVKGVLKSLGLVRPVIPQSMYIFKNSRIGGEVAPHRDGWYLHTEPTTLVGLWFPLDDATVENGCLWFSPGSHKCGEVETRFIRNPDPTADDKCIYTHPQPTYEDSKFVSVPVKAGSCVLIHGKAVHKSAKNESGKSRHAYTFHVVDTHNCKWSSQNWMQPVPNYDFPTVYDN